MIVPFHIRIQTHRQEAERFLIASMLMGEEFFQLVEAIIGREWAYLDDSKYIEMFEALWKMHDANEPIDPVTLSEKTNIPMSEIMLLFEDITRADFDHMECESACYYLIACEGGRIYERRKYEPCYSDGSHM